MHDQIIITSNNQLHNTQEYWAMAFSGSAVFMVGNAITIHAGSGITIGTIMDVSDNGDYLISTERK